MTTEERLIELFQDAFSTDMESFEGRGITAIILYNTASPKKKETIDRMFVALCGWSFKVLYREAIRQTGDK